MSSYHYFRSRRCGMDVFRALISFWRETRNVDFIKQLPLEVALLILKRLDNKSFFFAMNVSRQWAKICRVSGRRKKKINNSSKMFHPVQWSSRSIMANRLWGRRKEAEKMSPYRYSQVSFKANRLPLNKQRLQGNLRF